MLMVLRWTIQNCNYAFTFLLGFAEHVLDSCWYMECGLCTTSLSETSASLMLKQTGATASCDVFGC